MGTDLCGKDTYSYLPPDQPTECVLAKGHWGRCAAEGETPDAGHYNDEDAWNFDTDKFDRRKIRVMCPGCGREGSPLCSPRTEQTRAEWRWVGLDHRQPEADYKTTCRCGTSYTFTIFTPQ